MTDSILTLCAHNYLRLFIIIMFIIILLCTYTLVPDVPHAKILPLYSNEQVLVELMITINQTVKIQNLV